MIALLATSFGPPEFCQKKCLSMNFYCFRRIMVIDNTYFLSVCFMCSLCKDPQKSNT